jgi:hypothetical protein
MPEKAGISPYFLNKPDRRNCRSNGKASRTAVFLRSQSRRSGSRLSLEANIAILAGQIAHGRFYKPVATGDANAGDDSDLINDLLEEMYATNDARWSARNELYERAKKLVEQRWTAIESLAETLWAKAWSTEVPKTGRRKKRMNGDEVRDALWQNRISAVVL